MASMQISSSWLRTLSSPTCIADAGGVDTMGHVVLGASLNSTPTATGDALIESFDATNGSSCWAKMFAIPGSDGVGTVIFGRNGDLYATVGLGGAFGFGMPIIGAAGPAAVLLRVAP